MKIERFYLYTRRYSNTVENRLLSLDVLRKSCLFDMGRNHLRGENVASRNCTSCRPKQWMTSRLPLVQYLYWNSDLNDVCKAWPKGWTDWMWQWLMINDRLTNVVSVYRYQFVVHSCVRSGWIGLWGLWVMMGDHRGQAYGAKTMGTGDLRRAASWLIGDLVYFSREVDADRFEVSFVCILVYKPMQ